LGGGISCRVGNPVIINCTITDNISTEHGGGIYCWSGSRPTIVNCIIAGNSDVGGSGESAQIYGGSPSVNYSCVQEWTGSLGGSGNIGDDPLFVDPMNDNYRLQNYSPCIDAGDSSAIPPSIITDIDGNPRIINSVEMGAYEVTGLLSRLTVALDIKPGGCPNPLNLNSWGVLPVAVLGSEQFDVNTIDVASVRLESVAAIRHSYEDVAAAVSDDNECNCTTEGPDGYIDLTLKFSTQEIVDQLINEYDDLAKDQILTLELRGELFEDSVIIGSDCVTLVGNVPKFLLLRNSDINSDGIVNFLDLAKLAEYWFEYTVP
jgi:parallel beta-helix repeat protein